MIVYVEYVIIDNAVIDAILLVLACKTAGCKVVKWRIAVASLFGAMVAVAFPLVPTAVGYVIRLGGVIAMAFIASRYKPFVVALLTVLYTFLFGGMLVGVLSLANINYDIVSNGFIYHSNLPFSIYIVAVVMVVYLVVVVTRFIASSKIQHNYLIDLTVLIDSKAFTCRGYIDSGNSLVCQNLPVCFVTGQLASVVSNTIARLLIGGSSYSIEFQTVSGSSSCLACKGQLVVGDNLVEVLLAPKKGKFNGYEILLHNSLRENTL